MKKLLLFIFCSAGLLRAQTPVLVKDINLKGDSWGKFIDYDLSSGDRLLFADDSIHGYELWITDGTVSGTKLLKDINPNGDAIDGIQYIVFKNELYFFANDGVHGMELWKTDGTASGTQLFKDIDPTGGQDNPAKYNSIVIGDQFYFVADDGVHGIEVWQSDGTLSGTKLHFDLNASGSMNQGFDQFEKFVVNLIELKNELVFAGTSGYEWSLWKLSIGGDTTRLIDDLKGTTNMKDYCKFNEHIYFRHNISGKYGLYVTDGTVSGSKLYKDIFWSKEQIVYHNDLYVLGDHGDDRNSCNLWKISGLDNSITLVKKISAKKDYTEDGIHLVNDKMLFVSKDSTAGYALFVSDGTGSGTRMLKDFSLEGPDANGYNANMYVYNNELFVNALISQEEGLKLYKTNGENVQLVCDFNPGEGYGDINSFGVIKGALYMIADGKDVGLELFKYDGLTGVKDQTAENETLLYPNPVRDNIHLSVTDIESLKIIDLSGHLISETSTVQGPHIIDVSSLDQGVYLLEIHLKNKNVMVQKFVKD